MGKIFGDVFKGDIFSRLAVNPTTAPFMAQPDFVKKLNEIQANPSSLTNHLGDQRIVASLSVLMNIPVKQPSGQQTTPPSSSRMETDSPKSSPSTSSSSTSTKREPEKPKEPEKVLTETQRKAEDEKNKGNEAYKNKDFETAIKHYNLAIETDPENIVYLTNRAGTHSCFHFPSFLPSSFPPSSMSSISMLCRPFILSNTLFLSVFLSLLLL